MSEVPAPVLTGEIATRLDAVLRAVCDDLKADVMALAIIPVHVHLLLRLPNATLAPAQIAFRLKERSSRLLRQEFSSLRSRLPTRWNRSYHVAAVHKAVIARSIAVQRVR